MKFRTPLIGSIALILGLSVLTTLSAQTSKRQRQGYLGVSIERISVLEKKELGVTHGVLVTDVQEKSPAAEAGLKEDDVIPYFDGKKIRKTEDLTDKVRETAPGATVKVTLQRSGQRLDKDVKVGKLRSAFAIGRTSYFNFVGGAHLGISLHDMDADLAAYFGVKEDEGVLILGVSEDSPAEKAGIKAGDILVAIEDEEVGDSGDIHEILSEFDEGDAVSLTVLRHNKKVTVKATLEENDWNRGIRILGDGISQVHTTPQIFFENQKKRSDVEVREFRNQAKRLQVSREAELKAIQEAKKSLSVIDVRVI